MARQDVEVGIGYAEVGVRTQAGSFKFKAEKTENGFSITIDDCPWHNLMIKSGREKLSGAVGTIICNTEYQVWISEFAEKMQFKLKSQKCNDSKCCILEFAT